MIDLRSDTFTLPTPAMLQAMQQAPVGDDVFGEDPTINELERFVADMFGMEAAIFCPSGTMTNQIAIRCHTQPGDEVICDELSHVYQFEGGGIALNSQCSVKLLNGDRGRIDAELISASINNPLDPHKALSKLVSIENTTNFGGGACYDFDAIVAMSELCKSKGLGLHLDGARLMNAIVAQHQEPKQYGAVIDSISLCLSKGLGAPVGSVLIANKAFIAKARRVRKAFGGGMRQAGYIAAAGLYALQHHVNRLAEDHTNAKKIAQCLTQQDYIGKMLKVETNIIIFEIIGKYTPKSFCEILASSGIKCLAISLSQVRMVTHLGVTNEMVSQLIQTLEQL